MQRFLNKQPAFEERQIEFEKLIKQNENSHCFQKSNWNNGKECKCKFSIAESKSTFDFGSSGKRTRFIAQHLSKPQRFEGSNISEKNDNGRDDSTRIFK